MKKHRGWWLVKGQGALWNLAQALEIDRQHFDLDFKAVCYFSIFGLSLAFALLFEMRHFI